MMDNERFGKNINDLLRGLTPTQTREARSFSVDKECFLEFKKICKKLNINSSQIVNGLIKDFVEEYSQTDDR